MATETRNSLIAGHMNVRYSIEQAQMALPYWNDSDDKVQFYLSLLNMSVYFYLFCQNSRVCETGVHICNFNEDIFNQSICYIHFGVKTISLVDMRNCQI